MPVMMYAGYRSGSLSDYARNLLVVMEGRSGGFGSLRDGY